MAHIVRSRSLMRISLPSRFSYPGGDENKVTCERCASRVHVDSSLWCRSTGQVELLCMPCYRKEMG